MMDWASVWLSGGGYKRAQSMMFHVERTIDGCLNRVDLIPLTEQQRAIRTTKAEAI